MALGAVVDWVRAGPNPPLATAAAAGVAGPEVGFALEFEAAALPPQRPPPGPPLLAAGAAIRFVLRSAGPSAHEVATGHIVYSISRCQNERMNIDLYMLEALTQSIRRSGVIWFDHARNETLFHPLLFLLLVFSTSVRRGLLANNSHCELTCICIHKGIT